MSLIADIRNDLEKSALQLFVEYYARLQRVALRLCEGDSSQAEDLVLRTFERVLAKSDTYKVDANLFGWMKSIMEHIHQNDIKRPVVRRTTAVEASELERYAGEDWSTDEQLLKNSDSEAIRNAIRGLDPKLHKVLMMRYYEDLSLKEISNVLRLPMGTVAWRLHVARRLLAGKLSVILGRTKKPLAVIATVLSFSFLSLAAVFTGWLADGDDGGTGVPPVQVDNGGTGVPPVQVDNGGTGVPPVQVDSGGTGVPPVQEKTVSGPKQKDATPTQTNMKDTKKENTMNIRKIAAAAGAALLGMVASADDYIWLPTEANTEATPYLWDDPGNWEANKIPVPGIDSVVNMKSIPAAQHIQLPDAGITFGDFYVSGSAQSYFRGGMIRFEKTAGKSTFSLPAKHTRFYMPIVCPGDLDIKAGNHVYLRNTVSVAGILENSAGGMVHLCPSTALATNAFPTGEWKLSGKGTTLGIDAAECSCANRVFQEVDEIRVVADAGIGLTCKSANATEGGTGANMTWLRVKKLTGSSTLELNHGGANGQNWVGTFAVEDLSGFTGAIKCNVSRLWFAPGPNDSRTPYLKKYSLNSASNFAGCRGRIGVPEADVNAVLGEMYLADRQAGGTTTLEFYKTGAGKLTVSNYVQDATPQYGTINIQQGALWLRSESGAIVQPNLIVDSDAVLEVSPDTTLTVNNATLPSTFTLGGGGKLVVLGGDRPANIILRDGATVSFPNRTDVLPSDDGIVPAVAGYPAFWVDASKKESLVFNTGSTVSINRWNDCRKASEDDGYMYAATYEGGTRSPVWLTDASPNKMGVVHIRRLGNDISSWEGLYWNQALTNIRCVFMVYGTVGSAYDNDSGAGGGFFLGNGPLLSTASFNRNSMDYWDAGIVNSSPGGTWYRDGTVISATASNGYRPGYQLIEAINMNAGTGAQSFGTIMNKGCGRNRICECIVYTNTLTEAERKATAEYLYRKWFRRPYPGILAGSPASAVASVTVADGGAVEAAQDMAVTTLTAGGDFTKTGEGTLFVSETDASADVTVAEGRLTFKSAPSRGSDLPRAWFHADATRADTLVSAGEQDGTNFIRRWRDCNGGQVSLFTTENRTRQPFVHTDALNGLPVVDLGRMDTADETTANQTVLFFQDASVRGESYEDGSWTTNRNFRDVFVVWGSENGGNDFMTAEGGTAWRPFPRSSVSTATGKILSGLEKDANRLGVWRKDGAQVINPSDAGLSGTYDLVSFHGQDVSNAFRACSFGYASQKSTGGMQLGEVLVYTNALSQEEILCVEAYLRQKWFGVETPGRKVSTVAGVTALKGATLAVEGSLDVGRIGGAGTVVKGNVNLAAGGVIELQVNADGTVSPLTVAAPATLVALGGGTIRLTGEVAKLGINRLAAVLGNVAFPEGSSWTVENVPNRCVCRAKVVNGKLIFVSQKQGLVLFVR